MLANPNIAQPNPTNSPSNSPTGGVKNDLGTAPSQIALDRTTTKNRKDLFLFNPTTSTDTVLINYGTTVTPSAFTAEILPGGSWRDFANSQGPISARAKVGTATLYATEFITLI